MKYITDKFILPEEDNLSIHIDEKPEFRNGHLYIGNNDEHDFPALSTSLENPKINRE